MSRLDDVVSFLKSIEYNVDNYEFVRVSVQHEIDYPSLKTIPYEANSTSKVFVDNPELINTDNLNDTKTIMYDVTIQCDSEDDLNTLSDNLLKRTHEFNKRSTIYALSSEFLDAFTEDASDAGVPDNWTGDAGLGEINVQDTYDGKTKVCFIFGGFGGPECHIYKDLGSFDVVYVKFNLASSNFASDFTFIGFVDDGETPGTYAADTHKGKTFNSVDFGNWGSVELMIIGSSMYILIDGVYDSTVDVSSITSRYFTILTTANGGFEVGQYIDDVEIYYGDEITKPTKMVYINQLNYGQEKYLKKSKKWQCTYRLAITYTI